MFKKDTARRMRFLFANQILVSKQILGSKCGSTLRGFALAFSTAILAISSPLGAAEKLRDVDGFWQHPDDPVWIEMSWEQKTGVALRNDNDPETVGFQVVKELRAGDKDDTWQGQVFVPQLDRYKDVVISLPDAETLRMTVKIGFLPFSLEWSRVDQVEMITTP